MSRATESGRGKPDNLLCRLFGHDWQRCSHAWTYLGRGRSSCSLCHRLERGEAWHLPRPERLCVRCGYRPDKNEEDRLRADLAIEEENARTALDRAEAAEQQTIREVVTALRAEGGPHIGGDHLDAADFIEQRFGDGAAS